MLKRITATPLRIILFLFALSSTLVILLTGEVLFSSNELPNNWGLYSSDFFENIMVEAHGLLFDILVLGVIFIILDSKRQKRMTLEQLKNDLSDYSTLDEPLYYNKKKRILNELQKEQVTNIQQPNLLLSEIELRDLYFHKAKLFGLKLHSCRLINMDFADSKLNSAEFNNSTFKSCSFNKVVLKTARFSNAQLKGLTIKDSYLERAKFTNANLRNANFVECDMKNVCFENADLRNATFKNCENLDREAIERGRNTQYVRYQ